MILGATIISALVGFALGAQCRLLALAATSGLVAACWLLGVPLGVGESAGWADSLTILGLLVVLQAFFLAGAVWRISGPRVPHPEGRPGWSARLGPAGAPGQITARGD